MFLFVFGYFLVAIQGVPKKIAPYNLFLITRQRFRLILYYYVHLYQHIYIYMPSYVSVWLIMRKLL